MIIFMSQAPILVVLIPLIVLIALFEMLGLRARRNIMVLSVVSLACLLATLPVSTISAAVASLLYAIGATLAVLLALYVLATARRGKQWLWFTGVLIACCVTLTTGIAARVTLAGENANTAALAIFTLTYMPGVSTLLYGLLAPDIPKPRGGV